VWATGCALPRQVPKPLTTSLDSEVLAGARSYSPSPAAAKAPALVSAAQRRERLQVRDRLRLAGLQDSPPCSDRECALPGDRQDAGAGSVNESVCKSAQGGPRGADGRQGRLPDGGQARPRLPLDGGLRAGTTTFGEMGGPGRSFDPLSHAGWGGLWVTVRMPSSPFGVGRPGKTASSGLRARPATEA
jgi:hypothetical protein